MARMRTVKPEFFRSAKLGQLEPAARLMFIGMWTEADDHGRGLAEPRHLAGTLFPFDRDVTERKVSRWLTEMAARGFITLYEANGSRYYYVTGWWHQKVNRPGPPRYPTPPGVTDSHPPNGESDSVNGTPSGVKGQGSEPPNPHASHSKTNGNRRPLASDRAAIPERTADEHEALARALSPQVFATENLR